MSTLLPSPTILPRDARLKSGLDTLAFKLPPELEAGEPPEARGLGRDGVRLMVSYRADSRIIHAHFRDLPDFLKAGDVLVINTSGTLNAALAAVRASDGGRFELHLSTHLPADLWIVEVRQPDGAATKQYFDAQSGEIYALPGGASAKLLTAYSPHERRTSGRAHLWIATLDLPSDPLAYLAAYGFPIRYHYVKQNWPSSAYQTVYATEMGSAEMPSAGRPFTRPYMAQLIGRGVRIAPLLLHCGTSSLEDNELPQDEFYRVPSATAATVNAARAEGRAVIAVGTTVVRALETVTGPDGITTAGQGWTSVIVTPQSGIRSVDGLLTGLHEPESTHLAMLEALAPRERLQDAYAEALAQRYLWHEFGDVHLILPG